MIRIVKAGERELQPLNLRGINVRACDPIPGPANCISAGFGEYVEPRRLDWTFDYHEVFFMLEGAPKIHVPGEEPVRFEPGDLGYIEKGTPTTIVVPERAYFLHVTNPARQE